MEIGDRSHAMETDRTLCVLWLPPSLATIER
jgi:hypothetical protein